VLVASDDIQDAQKAVDAVPRDHFLHHTLLPIRPWQTELQQPILHHVDTGVRLAWPEDIVPLAEPLEDHVSAELQKERLLEVAQHPVGWGREREECRRSGEPPNSAAAPHLHPNTDRTFLSM